MTEIDLCAWLSQAAPQDALEYHRGFLVLDTDPRISGFANGDRLELIQVAKPRVMGRREAACPSRAAPPRRKPLQLSRDRPSAAGNALAVVAAVRGGRVMQTNRSNRPRLEDISAMPVGEIYEAPGRPAGAASRRCQRRAGGRQACQGLARWCHRAALRRAGGTAAPATGQEHRHGTVRGRRRHHHRRPAEEDRVGPTQIAALAERIREPVITRPSTSRSPSRCRSANTPHGRGDPPGFAPARTVRTGKPTFRLDLKENR